LTHFICPQEKVEQQLDKQVEEGELVQVDKSDWAAPIIVVQKKDGEIRICGDFKVSINPFYIPRYILCPCQRKCLVHWQMENLTQSLT